MINWHKGIGFYVDWMRASGTKRRMWMTGRIKTFGRISGQKQMMAGEGEREREGEGNGGGEGKRKGEGDVSDLIRLDGWI
jgi:hypothetical protein